MLFCSTQYYEYIAARLCYGQIAQGWIIENAPHMALFQPKQPVKKHPLCLFPVFHRQSRVQGSLPAWDASALTCIVSTSSCTAVVTMCSRKASSVCPVRTSSLCRMPAA